MEILTGTLFRADVATTAQTAQTMCLCCSLSTAREIMETGVIPTSLFTNGLPKRSIADTANALGWHTVLESYTAPLFDISNGPPVDDQFH